MKKKFDLSAKTPKSYMELITACQDECTKVELHEREYKLKWLLEKLGADLFPKWAKLEKKYPGSKVINVGGLPIIQVKLEGGKR